MNVCSNIYDHVNDAFDLNLEGAHVEYSAIPEPFLRAKERTNVFITDMTGDRSYSIKRGRWCKFRLTSHRLGIILIVLSLVWGMYLIQIQLNDRQSQSEYLKKKIIALSKEYIDAVAKEKGLYSTELGVDSDNGNDTSCLLLVCTSAQYVKFLKCPL